MNTILNCYCHFHVHEYRHVFLVPVYNARATFDVQNPLWSTTHARHYFSSMLDNVFLPLSLRFIRFIYSVYRKHVFYGAMGNLATSEELLPNKTHVSVPVRSQLYLIIQPCPDEHIGHRACLLHWQPNKAVHASLQSITFSPNRQHSRARSRLLMNDRTNLISRFQTRQLL
jgi:hypothetical protein